MYSMLLLLSLCAVLFLSYSGSANAKAKSTGSSSEQKLNQITELASKSKDHVITLDDSTYPYYSTSKPCPYHLVIFLTASNPKYRCSICQQLDREFSLLASSYFETVQQNKAKPEVFFVRLDYESCQKIFQTYQVSSIPIIFHLAPRLIDRVPNTDSVILTKDKFQMPTDPDAESIANFLRDKTSIKITIKRSMLLSYVMIFVFFGVLLALVQPIISALPFILRIIRLKTIWYIICSGVYTCAISGLIFDIIRSPPMYYSNPQTGQIMFFYPQSSSQFVAEGFIIGFLSLTAGAALIFLSVYAPKFKSQRSKDYSVAAGMIVFFVCFWQVRSFYRMKNRWYGVAN